MIGRPVDRVSLADARARAMVANFARVVPRTRARILAERNAAERAELRAAIVCIVASLAIAAALVFSLPN